MKIAICGKMCSGKTTLANMIKRMDERYTIYSFASKIKDIAADVFEMKDGTKDRTLLTSIGTKMREIDPDVWINYVLKQTRGETHCLIDDLRYQNEYEALVHEGWHIIQLNVSPHIQKQRLMKHYAQNYQDHLDNDSHASEQNKFTWVPGKDPQGPSKDPVMVIDGNDGYEEVQQRVYSFIQKNEYSQ